jgi:hypothetical protein
MRAFNNDQRFAGEVCGPPIRYVFASLHIGTLRGSYCPVASFESSAAMVLSRSCAACS